VFSSATVDTTFQILLLG